MKRRDLEQHLAKHGCYVHREGGRHTVYVNPASSKAASLPRHNEIKTATARRICEQLEIPIPLAK